MEKSFEKWKLIKQEAETLLEEEENKEKYFNEKHSQEKPFQKAKRFVELNFKPHKSQFELDEMFSLTSDKEVLFLCIIIPAFFPLIIIFITIKFILRNLMIIK